MKTLTEIYNSVTDMYGQKSDKGTLHSYIEEYEQIFAPIRIRAVNVLEIGVACGSSIPLWHEYFENATILEVDNNQDKSCSKEIVSEFAASFLRSDYISNTDAYNLPTMYELLEKTDHDGFDVIIDDGSHSPLHQGFVLVEYGKILRPGGIIIIEDIVNMQYANILAYMMPLSYKCSIEIKDLTHKKNKSDDIMLILRKE